MEANGFFEASLESTILYLKPKGFSLGGSIVVEIIDQSASPIFHNPLNCAVSIEDRAVPLLGLFGSFAGLAGTS
jgi:hypothetical protein